MPYINVKVVKQQVDKKTKQLLINGIMDIIVNIMGRDLDLIESGQLGI